jgi:hypothetical protein
MEFLVEFEIDIPEGTAESEVEERENAEAPAAASWMHVTVTALEPHPDDPAAPADRSRP